MQTEKRTLQAPVSKWVEVGHELIYTEKQKILVLV